MTLDLQNSVVLITSSADGNKSFGTGFVVRRSGSSPHIVTCAHVIEAVGGIEQVRVKDLPAQRVAVGESDGIDLAVIIVPGLRNTVQGKRILKCS